MYIRALCAFILVFCLAISGCISSQYSGRSSREELLQSKAEIYQLNEQVASLSKELETMRKEMSQIKQTEEKKKAESGIQETSLISHANPVQETQIQDADIVKKEGPKKTTNAKHAVQGKELDIKTLKVKVLSGNGKWSTARDMSNKLAGMGYKIKDVGMSPRTNFTANTIYYAANYQKEAKYLAARLGNKTVSRPLSWSSVFHIIVVAAP